MITCPSGFIIHGDFSNDEEGKDSENLKIWTSAANRHFGGMLVKPASAGMAQENRRVFP